MIRTSSRRARTRVGSRLLVGAICTGITAASVLAISSQASNAATVTTWTAKANALDTFQRTVSSGFGVANQGGSWATAVASNYSVPADHGHIVALSAGSSTSSRIRNVSNVDELARMAFSLPKLPTWASGQLVSVTTRAQASGSAIAAQVKVVPGGAMSVTLQEVTSSGTTNISAPVSVPFTATAGQSFNVDLQTTGTAPVLVSARVFPASQTTVPAFQVSNSVSDGTIVTTAGAVGLADATPVSTIGVAVDVQKVSGWALTNPVTTGTPDPSPTATPTATSTATATSSATPSSSPSPSPTSTTTSTPGPTMIGFDPSTVLGSWTPNELGFSFEYTDLTGSNLNPTPELVNLLKNLGPGVLRIGGNTLDAQSSTGPTSAQITALNQLLTQTGWKVLYSVPLATFNATAQGNEVKAVFNALGSKVLAFACGNEPNVYVQHNYKTSYDVNQYLSDVSACYNVVRANAPGVALAGPDTSNGGWVNEYSSPKPSGLGLLDQHLYPFNACVTPTVTADDLLSASVASGEANTVSMEYGLAKTDGVPLRISESNSIGCGGIRATSDTFAASLWDSDFALIAAENGASGINLHQTGMDTTCSTFSAVCRPGGGVFTAQEPYYGLLMDRQVGTGSLIANTGAGGANVAVHAVQHADGSLAIMLINRSNAAFPTTLVSPGNYTTAKTVAMNAPNGPSSTSGLNIGGNSVNTDGSFTAPAQQSASIVGGNIDVTVPAYSALLVNLS